MSDLRLHLPADLDDARQLYESDPVVNRVVNEVTRHAPATSSSVLRREYGAVIRVPAALVFGADLPPDKIDEAAMPDPLTVTESLGASTLVTEDDDEFDRYADVRGEVAPQSPLASPARFRVLDEGDETVAEGSEFPDGRVGIAWLTDESAPVESYEDLDHADRAMSDALRVAFMDPRPNASDRELVPDGGRRMAAQPEICPECGLTLTSGGECATKGCPGPDESGSA